MLSSFLCGFSIRPFDIKLSDVLSWYRYIFNNLSSNELFLLLASVGIAQPNLMLASPKEMTTEEMRRLLERNEVLNPASGPANLQPYDTMNV